MAQAPLQYPEYVFLPKLEDALRKVQRASKAPFPMIASSAIAAIALACQKGYQIERKPGMVYPIGLAFVTIGLPSERKTSVDRCFLNPIKTFQNSMANEYQIKLAEWKIKDGIYKAKRAGILRAITRNSSHDEDTSDYEKQLIELEKTTYEKPKETVLILKDANKEAILLFLKKYGNSCGVMVNEGSVFFESSGSKNSGMLADLWSGDDYRKDKSVGEGFTICNPRLTLSLMVQPDILKEFLGKKGKFWRASGLLSRFLVSYPDSKIGTRFENEYIPYHLDLSSYDKRISEILSSPQCIGLTENVILKFDERAGLEIVRFGNLAESQIAPWNHYSDVSDAGSKIAENATRMAALFHIFEGYEGPVTNDTLQRAIAICSWHITEFKALFGNTQPVISIYDDAEEIVRCIRGFHTDHGDLLCCPKVRISQFARGSLRQSEERREAAFNFLIQYGRIELFYLLNEKTQYVRLTPQYLNQNSDPSLLSNNSPII